MEEKKIQKRLLSTAEVADYLGVPKSTVRFWCFSRTIRHYKIGRHLKFRQIDIDEYVENKRR